VDRYIYVTFHVQKMELQRKCLYIVRPCDDRDAFSDNSVSTRKFSELLLYSQKVTTARHLLTQNPKGMRAQFRKSRRHFEILRDHIGGI